MISSEAERTQRFTTSDFTIEEEFGRPNGGNAPGSAGGPLGESFKGGLDDIDAVKVDSLDRPPQRISGVFKSLKRSCTQGNWVTNI